MTRFLRVLLILFALNTAYLCASVGTEHIPPVFFFTLATFLPFAFAVLHAGRRLGWKRMGLMLGVSFLVSLFFESVGVATGWVYGPYHYTDVLGFEFLGLVPLFVPLGWFLMSYPSFIIADWIVPADWRGWRRVLGVAALAALAMTAWDMVMDPARVDAGMWVWEVNGPYFGIPLRNYLGWWLTTFVALVLFMALARYEPPPHRDASFDRLAVASYGLIALAEVVSAWVLGLGGPALAGLFATLPWFLWGWMATAERRKHPPSYF